MNHFVVQERQELAFRYGPYSLAGAASARCPNPDMPGYGDQLLVADAFDDSDSSKGTILWRRKVGSRQWQQQELLERSYRSDFAGSWVKCGYGGICADAVHRVLLFFSNDTYWKNGDFETIKRCRRLYYRLSYDNGYTWTDKKYLQLEGKDKQGAAFDRDHFMEGVRFGVNSAAFVGNTLAQTEDGVILTGAHVQQVQPDGTLVEPSGFMFLKSAALRGIWDPARQDYRWEQGEYVSVEPGQSTRGVFEPCIVCLEKERLIMFLRASNMGREELVSTKYFSLSQDGGRHWTCPEPVLYDDGEPAFSSSSIPKLIRHSSGSLFFVGILNLDNPTGNLPRDRLCIAQVDPDTGRILRDSVCLIDDRRFVQTSGEEKYLLDFSNHCVFEEDSGELTVVAPFRKDLSRYESGMNLYRIQVVQDK